MQEATILDADGASREYGYDDFDGVLYVKDVESKQQRPGRPYRPIYKGGDYVRGLGAVHKEMWGKGQDFARQRLQTVVHRDAWRGRD